MGLEVGLEIIISEVISRFQVTSYKGPSTSHSETARTPKGGRREKMERKGTVCSCQLRELPSTEENS